jgi:hypothetical protein
MCTLEGQGRRTINQTRAREVKERLLWHLHEFRQEEMLNFKVMLLVCGGRYRVSRCRSCGELKVCCYCDVENQRRCGKFRVDGRSRTGTQK